MEDGNMTVGVTVSSLMEFIYREEGIKKQLTEGSSNNKIMSLCLSEAVEIFSSPVPR
jgi:hypothetical protein